MSMTSIFLSHWPLIFWYRVSPWSWSSLAWQHHQANVFLASSCLHIPDTRIIGIHITLSFYVDSWPPASGPYASMTRILQAVLSLHNLFPSFLFFCSNSHLNSSVELPTPWAGFSDLSGAPVWTPLWVPISWCFLVRLGSSRGTLLLKTGSKPLHCL